MKVYIKPLVEIIAFRADNDIAATSIFDYSDSNTIPVSLFGIEQNGWNGDSPS